MSRLSSRSSSILPDGWIYRAVTLLSALAGMGILSYLIVFGRYRFAIAVTVSLLLIALSVFNIRVSILGAFIYFVFMGDIRRMLIPSMGWSGEDPLLIIGPIFAMVVFGYAWSAKKITIDTPLAGWMSALMAVMALQMFNPRQGGLIVGVAGALFFIVPLLWYWIGRTYATPEFVSQMLFYVVVPLGGLATAFGLYQTFYGFLPYQELWADIAAGPGLLGSEGIEKPISFFASPTEHDNFILSAVAVLIAAVIHRRQYGLLVFIIPMVVTIILGGSRGPVAKLLVTTAGLWAVIGTNLTTWIVRGAVALLVGVIGISWTLSSVEVDGANKRIKYRLQRQEDGLAEGNALGGNSTLNHVNMIYHGVKKGITQPLGMGLGYTTKAAAKYGGGGGSTEGDASDVFLSTGIVGGVLYLTILFLVIRSAFRYWVRTRSLLALCLAGVLSVNFLLWLNGGQYAVCPLLWFLIGALDRFANAPEGASSEADPDQDPGAVPDPSRSRGVPADSLRTA